MALLPIPGVDAAEGVRRCGGSEALYLRFLKQFAQDTSFSLLKSAIETGDWPEAFRHAHTLKGLSAQLSIPSLYGHCDRLCEALRTPCEDTQLRAAKAFDSLASQHVLLTAELLRLP